ncbi:hypothetical protein BC834DRAFT_880819, partial [Gloeopeniophorella convolvens]
MARAALAPGGCALVLYMHHRPHLATRDMAFFAQAREEVVTERFPPMFPEDLGAEVWATVYGWKLTRDAD